MRAQCKCVSAFYLPINKRTLKIDLFSCDTWQKAAYCQNASNTYSSTQRAHKFVHFQLDGILEENKPWARGNAQQKYFRAFVVVILAVHCDDQLSKNEKKKTTEIK